MGGNFTSSHPLSFWAFTVATIPLAKAILSGEKEHLVKSTNDYDWLGAGIYFWESNPQRAFEFAQQRMNGAKHSKGTIKKPFVVGAIINLGHSLNLNDSSALTEMRGAYEALFASSKVMGFEMPRNGESKKMRFLDYAVFQWLHLQRQEQNLRQYDSVRGTYHEGDSIYPGTDISHQDHTQVCVRNTDCILGYFRPIKTKA